VLDPDDRHGVGRHAIADQVGRDCSQFAETAGDATSVGVVCEVAAASFNLCAMRWVAKGRN